MKPDAPTLHQTARTPPPGWVQRAQPQFDLTGSAVASSTGRWHTVGGKA